MAKQMKQFEEWWCDESIGPEADGYDLAQQAWKAALEWVKSRSEKAKSLYMINVNDVNDELGDK